ncbi:MAG TPA: fluoride efflux transporter CrcB [Stellaceae bacterium]|nr:fluoride efflux transporter CrcB [Stellaceae bacterium]
MSALVWVTLGSAIGGMGRYWCSGAVARRYGEQFPWGTFFVNVVGSFVIGLFSGWGPDGTNLVDPGIRQFVMAGICGGYTTFSSFSLQTLNLARDGQWRRVWANIILSTVTCFIAVWIGFAVARMTG